MIPVSCDRDACSSAKLVQATYPLPQTDPRGFAVHVVSPNEPDNAPNLLNELYALGEFGKGVPSKTDLQKMQQDCLQSDPSTPNTYNYLDTDALKRATGAIACMTKRQVAKDSSCDPPGINSDPGLRRGHLIGVSIGGVGSSRDAQGGCTNITPIDFYRNYNMRDGSETMARSLLAKGLRVSYAVFPAYHAGNLVPYSIYVFVTASDGESYQYRYDNPQGATSPQGLTGS
jgi:hypothetical protein